LLKKPTPPPRYRPSQSVRPLNSNALPRVNFFDTRQPASAVQSSEHPVADCFNDFVALGVRVRSGVDQHGHGVANAPDDVTQELRVCFVKGDFLVTAPVSV